MAHRDEFDIICAGGGLVDGSIVEKYLENMKYILEGNEGAPFPGEHFPPLNGDENRWYTVVVSRVRAICRETRISRKISISA